MHYTEIEREIRLLKDNLEYKKKLLDVHEIQTLECENKFGGYVGLHVSESWYEFKEELHEVINNEIQRTDEAIDAIAERLGTTTKELLGD